MSRTKADAKRVTQESELQYYSQELDIEIAYALAHIRKTQPSVFERIQELAATVVELRSNQVTGSYPVLTDVPTRYERGSNERF